MLDQDRTPALESAPFVAAAIEAPVGRWAVCVRSIVAASQDVPTVGAWAGIVNMGRSTLCSRCRAAHASARDSLAFGRLARALTLDDALTLCTGAPRTSSTSWILGRCGFCSKGVDWCRSTKEGVPRSVCCSTRIAFGCRRPA